MSEPLYDWLTSSRFDCYLSNIDAKVAILNKKKGVVSLRTYALHSTHSIQLHILMNNLHLA